MDTNIIEYWFNQNRPQHAAVVARREALPPDAPIFISAVTLGEIEYGYQCQEPRDEKRELEFRTFVWNKNPLVLAVDQHTAEPYGKLRAAIFERFAPKELRRKIKRPCQLTDKASATSLDIDENDLWIAAQAIQYNLVLVTNDRMHHIRSLLAHVAPDLPVPEEWAN